MMNKLVAIWHILTRRNYFVLTKRADKISVQAATPDERGIIFELILWGLKMKKEQMKKRGER